MVLIRFSVALFLACIAMQSCTRNLDLSGKRCPCVQGYVCDLATGICVVPSEADASTDGPDVQRLTVTSAALGNSHTCVLLSNGSVKCWGGNSQGQLGYANTNQIGDDPNEIPVNYNAVDIGGQVTALTAGAEHTCALLDDGHVRCWGRGNYGQLGYQSDQSIGDDEAPSEAGDVDIGGIVVQIDAGAEHTCALLDDGAVRCWGEGSDGRLGYGNEDNIGITQTPRMAGNVALGGKAIQIIAGTYHTCAVLENRQARCWGRGTYGALGYGNTADVGAQNQPQDVGTVSAGGAIARLSAGENVTCAILLGTADARCWGDNFHGQLGYGHQESIGNGNVPDSAPPLSLGGEALQIVSGEWHTCAIIDDNSLRCWGYSQDGQLGYGHVATLGDDAGEVPSSFDAVHLDGQVNFVAAGKRHNCAVLVSGAMRCWGDNQYGQLGYGDKQTIGDDERPGDLPAVSVVP